MKLNVLDVIGKYAMTPDAGQAVYDAIYPRLRAGEQVELDFSGVEIFASPFFNVAMGQLLRDIQAEELQRLLTTQSLTRAGQIALERVKANASRYYSDARIRAAQDRVFDEQAALV
jgi:hypothetical protein